MRRNAVKFHYAWVVVGVTFAVLLDHGRRARRTRRADRAVRGRVPLVAGDDLVRGRRQSSALRSGRAVRRGTDGPFRGAPDDDRGAGADGRRRRADAIDARDLAARAALGCGGRIELRARREFPLGLCRGALVQGAPGRRHRRIDRIERRRSADLSADDGGVGDICRLARHVAGPGGGRRRGRAAGGNFDARPSRGAGAPAVRRAARNRGRRQACGQSAWPRRFGRSATAPDRAISG